MRKSAVLLLLAAACSSGTSGGTGTPTPDAEMRTEDVAAACAAQQDGVILRQFFSGPADFARVLLCESGRYRAETDAGGIRFTLRPLMPGIQEPQVVDIIVGGGGQMGMGTRREVRAVASGVFEIRVQGFTGGGGTQLTVTRDGTWR